MQQVFFWFGLILAIFLSVGAARTFVEIRPSRITRTPEIFDYQRRHISGLWIVIALMAWGWWLTYFFAR